MKETKSNPTLTCLAVGKTLRNFPKASHTQVLHTYTYTALACPMKETERRKQPRERCTEIELHRQADRDTRETGAGVLLASACA